MIAKTLTTIALVAAAASAQPLTKRDSIVCQPKSDAAWLYQGDAIYAGQGTLVGFKGDNLAFDGRSGDLAPAQFQSSVCSSQALNLTTPGSSDYHFGDPHPIKLSLADEPDKCLTLVSNTDTNTYLITADCADEDTEEAQARQFFLQHYKYASIQPFGSKQVGWGLEIYDNPSGQIIANPNTCPDGQTCQTDNKIALRLG